MKPNIVFFIPDQMRADALHHLGNEASCTPNLDALCEDGVSYSSCFCQNPVCVPSRCSFMTGQYPHVMGHRTMNYLLRPGEANLLKTLKENGYHVVCSGRGDLLSGKASEYQKQCMDEVLYFTGKPNYKLPPRPQRGERGHFSFFRGLYETADGNDARTMDVSYVESGISYLRRRDKNKPFMMFMALNDPHPPYITDKKYRDMIDKSKLPERKPVIGDTDGKPMMETGLRDALGVAGWSGEELDEIRATYLGMCAKVDSLFGKLVAELKAQGIYDNTAIFFFSDHGDYTGDYGIVEKAQNCFPDCLVNVPLLIKPPKGCKVDSGVNNNLAELLDVYATALEFAGVQPACSNSSVSLLESIADRAVRHREFVCCEGGRRNDEIQAIETPTALAGDEYEPRMSLQAKNNGGHGKATMLRTREYKYIRRLYESDEFYDLSKGEGKNLIDEAQYKEIIASLKEKLLGWYQESCDTVPSDEDERFPDEFYFHSMLSAGAPKIAVSYVKGIMKRKKCSFFDAVSGFNKLIDKHR